MVDNAPARMFLKALLLAQVPLAVVEFVADNLLDGPIVGVLLQLWEGPHCLPVPSLSVLIVGSDIVTDLISDSLQGIPWLFRVR